METYTQNLSRHSTKLAKLIYTWAPHEISILRINTANFENVSPFYYFIKKNFKNLKTKFFLNSKWQIQNSDESIILYRKTHMCPFDGTFFETF